MGRFGAPFFMVRETRNSKSRDEAQMARCNIE
jgi:hypothetical protein